VTDRYESHRDFFYPTPHSHVISDKENRSLDALDAEVMLAKIPFVCLRRGIPEHLLEGKTSFSESIKFARLIEDEPKLKIDYAKSSLWVTDIQIALTPINFIFYIWILERSLRGEYIERPGKEEFNKEYAEEIKNISERYSLEMKLSCRVDVTFKLGITGTWISGHMNDVNSAFKNALGKQAAIPYEVKNIGDYNNSKYHIALTKEQITYS
jgi:hypothetical protein